MNFHLLITKGVFPYSYIDDNLEKLEENQLPPKEAFFCKIK